LVFPVVFVTVGLNLPGDAAPSGMESAGAAILGREQDTWTGFLLPEEWDFFNVT
jgi:hypothetical protein